MIRTKIIITINEELKQYNLRLTERPQIIVRIKWTCLIRKKISVYSKKNLEDDNALIFPISAITRKGLDDLFSRLQICLKSHLNSHLHEIEEDKKTLSFTNMKGKTADFEITRDDDGAYVLSGYTIERLFKMTDFNFDASVRKFARQMRGMGIDDALRERGAKDGDTVRLLDFEFEFIE